MLNRVATARQKQEKTGVWALAVAALTAFAGGSSLCLTAADAQSLAPAPPTPSAIPGLAPQAVTPGTVPGLAPPYGQNQAPCSSQAGHSPVCDLGSLGQNPKVIPGLPFNVPVPTAFKQAPKFDPNMWKAGRSGGGPMGLGGLLPAGTVLTGILENDIDSGKNKQGDIFSIRLEDGFQSSTGALLIPKQSKIVGTIVSVVPAKSQRNGNPGKIDVSLQSLVLPDGRSMPICAFLDYNPNSKTVAASNPGKTAAGYGFRGMNQMLGMVTGRVGFRLSMPRYGNDFALDQGDILPVKLSRSLDLKKLKDVTPPLMPNQIASRPPMNSMQAPMQKPVELSAGPMKSLSDLEPSMSTGPQADPNAIFETPIQPQPSRSTLNEMPDPF